MNKNNLKAKQILKINLRKNYFMKLIFFCCASQQGATEEGATPLAVTWLGCHGGSMGPCPGGAAPLSIARHPLVQRH
jgi:hypothetical protein